MAQQRARDGEALLLAAGDLHAAFADTVSSPRSARASRLCADGLPQDVEALLVGRVGPHEEQVLADGAGEQLRVLGDEADALAEAVDVDLVLRRAVVVDVPGLRPVEADQQLHERGLARRPRADERDGLAAARRGNEMSVSAGVDADWCWKVTSSKREGVERVDAARDARGAARAAA